MAKRLRRHLNPSLVISMIALFAALGGGYAVAFSGSGSLQKAGSTGCPTSFDNFRTLTGFGAIQLSFSATPNPDELKVRLANDTSRQVVMDFFNHNTGSHATHVVEPGTADPAPFVLNATGSNFAEFHLSKAGTSSTAVRAQVEGQVRAALSNAGVCTTSRVLALNTEQ